MKLTNTLNTLKELGERVTNQGKRNLVNSKPYPKTTKANTLYNDFNYQISSTDNSASVKWVFGGAEDYWEYVDEGVEGAGFDKLKNKSKRSSTTKSGEKSKRGATGTIRGKGSPFKFTNKMPPRNVIDKWIVRKPLKQARDKSGRFIERKAMAFLIQRSIFQKGLYRTLFFSKPYKEQTKKFNPLITEAFANDIMDELKTILKK